MDRPPEAVIPPGAAPLVVTPFDKSAPPALSARVVTALRVVGENVQLDLPPEQAAFTLGAAPQPVVDLTLAGEHVSRLHVKLTRKGAKLRVEDLGSTNGTFLRGHRDPDFEIGPGQVFEVTRRIKLLALDPPLALLRHALLWVLGLRNHADTDAAIQIIAANEPILLLGDPGCEQRALAEEIHRRSPFNDRELVTAPARFASRAEQDQVLARGTRSTIYLDLFGSAERLPLRFVSQAFAECRPIVAAPSRARASEVLDRYFHQLRTIELVPPANRRDDIPRLLDALIAREHAEQNRGGELLSIVALGESNVAALKAQPWPGHFADLRRQVKRLHAVLTNGLRARASARALGLKSVASLIEALDRIGVRLTLSDGDELPIDVNAADPGHLPIPPGSPTR